MQLLASAFRSLFVASLALAVGCALPPTSFDVEQGEQVALSIEGQVGTYGDPGLTAWFEPLTDELVAELEATPFEYQFAILDQSEPNAFAAPGGFIFVSRGLLALAGSVDEVAGVVAHEIVHVEERHSIKQLRRASLPRLLQVPGRIVGLVAKDIGNLINSPLAGLDALRSARYGRSQEREADELGSALAARAGYRPGALGDLLTTMERFIDSVSEESSGPSFFDSHPPTPERVDDVRARAASLPVGPRPATAVEDQAFLASLDGLVFGDNPARGVFEGSTFSHPDLGVALDFPEGWETFSTATAAGAVAREGDALVLYGLAELGGGAALLGALAEERRTQMREEASLAPLEDESLDLEGLPGRLQIYDADEEHRLFFVWVDLGGSVHQLLGVARPSDRDVLRASVGSLRLLSEVERRGFAALRLRIVAAEAGQTLRQVAAREGNVLQPEVLAGLNGVALDEPLPSPRVIKVVRREPYSASP